jgi:hypothetical protein
MSVCVSNHHVSKERSDGVHVSRLVKCLLSNSAYISDLDFLLTYGLFKHALSGYDYSCDYFKVSVHGALRQLLHIHSMLGTQLSTVTAFRFVPLHSPGMMVKKKIIKPFITLTEIRKGPVSPWRQCSNFQLHHLTLNSFPPLYKFRLTAVILEFVHLALSLLPTHCSLSVYFLWTRFNDVLKKSLL